jgi:hypothetical protein
MATILCNRLPSDLKKKKRHQQQNISYVIVAHTSNWPHKGDWPYGWTTWMNFDNMDEIEYWKWNWPQGQTNGWNWWHDWAIWYDMYFFKDVYFHVIYHLDENKYHRKTSHIDEVDNIDELPNYGFFVLFFSFLFNFVISRIWWISHKSIKIQDFLSGFKDFHLVFVNCQIVWKCFSKYHWVQGKQLWRKNNTRKWSLGD